MDIAKLSAQTNWVKMWSAKGSFHFDSHLGEIWTSRNDIADRPMYQQVVFFYANGVTDCWATQADRDNLGARLSTLARQDAGYVAKIANDLERYAKKVEEFINTHAVESVGLAEYNQFWQLVYSYYLPHVSVKYLVDYVSADELKTILPVLEPARKAAEPIYREIEDYVVLLAGHIAAANGCSKEMIMATTRAEMEAYFNGQPLPDGALLQQRYERSAIIFDKDDSAIFVNGEVDSITEIVSTPANDKIITGQIAYKGIVKGRVKIVLNASDPSIIFTPGDILVAGMTRPEFLPLLLKAAGFVTDSGGILSHAAISARELKKPCIIGTKIATQMLKDGDMVEVDAINGVVKIIK